MTLNPEQQKAIDTIDGPILILAGAGSGKTRVLTYKIFHLLKNKFATVEEILAVTFTNKAADEMKTRVLQLTTGKENPDISNYQKKVFLPWMGTFHSICLRLLKKHADKVGLSPSFVIYDTSDQLDAVKSVIKKMDLNDKKINAKAVLSYISSAKNELIDPEKYAQFSRGYFQDIVAGVYPEYNKTLQNNNALDFDDLLFFAVKLLEENPEILKKYQEQFKYILIDEYQDTNHAQYKFTQLLASKQNNICVVGDDAQSIYGFRGANIQNILNFERDYPKAVIIKLEQNYRSTKVILDASNRIISLNQNQKKKNMWTENKSGDKIYLYEGENEREEAGWIAQRMQELINSSVKPEDIVVLYRTHAQSRALEEGLLQYGLQYKIIGGFKFYARKEIKDIISYLRVIYNPKDDQSLVRIINIPKRNIGPKKILGLSEKAHQLNLSITEWLLTCPKSEIELLDSNVRNFAELMKKFMKSAPEILLANLIQEIAERSGYYAMLNDGTEESESRLDNIKELLTVAGKFHSLQPSEALEAFLNEVALIEGEEKEEKNGAPKVTLMTIHSAKGLEFKHVFIAGMEEGLFPHSRAYMEPSEMEEERRLAYVAFTRAKENLYLTYTSSRLYFGTTHNNPVSRFVTDIPHNLLTIEERNVSLSMHENEVLESRMQGPPLIPSPGDFVRHEVFGVGRVVELNDEVVIIDFPSGKKELAIEYARLVKI